MPGVSRRANATEPIKIENNENARKVGGVAHVKRTYHKTLSDKGRPRNSQQIKIKYYVHFKKCLTGLAGHKNKCRFN